jgi:hypothetical protein
MPFVPSFTAIQVLGEPSQIEFTDTSTGSSSLITARRIYVQLADSTYLVEKGNTNNYTYWDINEPDIILTLLSKDIAAKVTVQWLNSSSTVLWDSVSLQGFTGFNEEFDYQLTQLLTANPLLINDNDFFPSKSNLRTSIDSGNQAISIASDLYAAQQCYDRATNLRTSSQYYFNINS